MNRSFGSSFVWMSATLSSVLQCTSLMLLSIMASRVKWYFMSMCLVLDELVLLFVTAMEAWLSPYTVTGGSLTPMMSAISCLSHMASRVAWYRAMYSASAVDVATVDWRLLYQLTAPPPTRYTWPEVDILLSRSRPNLSLSILVDRPSCDRIFLQSMYLLYNVPLF